MEFLASHYGKGLKDYLQNWLYYFDLINHRFPPFFLLRTLFSPWKRLISEDNSSGFNLQKKIEATTFNIVSRFMGAVARLALVVSGLTLLILISLAGIFGFIMLLTIPILGFPAYGTYKKRPSEILDKLIKEIEKSQKSPTEIILESSGGQFILSHLETDKQTLLKNANQKNLKISGKSFSTFKELFTFLNKENIWSKAFLRKNSLTKKDFLLAASWWDRNSKELTTLKRENLGRAGPARELLFGYTPNLNRYSEDLSAPRSYSHRLIGRANVVSRMERTLTAGNSVVLIGEPGVGKKTVVLEFANRAATGQLGQNMSYKRVVEFDYNYLLSESIDVNKKKAELSKILKESAYAGNIILMIKDIQRLTHPDLEGFDFTGVFEQYLEKKDLKLIVVTTPTEYERFIAPNMRLRKYLQTIEVAQPTKSEAMEILIESAARWESRKKLTILVPALRKILEESDRYITEVPFPEKALEILDSLVVLVEKKDKDIIDTQDVNEILVEKTGISFTALTKQQRVKLGKLEEIIHERLIDQDASVSLIARSLRARTVGAKGEDRPVGSFLFLGPTGVGKTETAKVLAQVYYGSEDKIIRFDMAEYAGSEGFERLIGSQQKNLPGALTTKIKNNPASLLLLDELEKATPAIYNLFLGMLDEGFITDAFGKKINCKNLFIIGTSNAGAEFIRQQVSKGVKGKELQNKVLEHVLEKQLFSPEFLNRFDGVVVYEPLGEKELVQIAHLMLDRFAKDLKRKGLKLTYPPETAEKLARDGHDPAFGARPMRRIVDLILGDLVGKAILEENVKDGDTIKILPDSKKEEFIVKKA